MAFLANIFGYVLNFFYSLIGNYGLAIILFCLVIKVLMIPLSIKQQKTQKKTVKLQSQMKQIQFQYKNDPEKMNQATMELYKRENMSPFSGCLVAIIQMVLLFAVFFMVKEPLTYMKKIEPELIEKYVNVLKEEQLISNEAYSQIAVISEADRIKDMKETGNTQYSEKDQKISDAIGENIDQVYTNMNFLGIDLSKVPTQSPQDFRVYIIPVLYVISSFISIKLTTSMQAPKKKKEPIEVEGGEEGKEKKDTDKKQEDMMANTNKMMSWFMPVMAVSISLIAPLGLALYWLTNNILMIVERLILNKVLKDEEE